MSQLTRSFRTRVAQIHASTLFAVILAIVAGLIFAWVFKMVFLNGKPKPVSAPVTRRLTVAAVNVFDKMQILGSDIKTITVTEEEHNSIVNDPKHRSRVMLMGTQPIGRTTIRPIRAEEPIFEDQLEPLQYPEPVSVRLSEGKRAVQISVPPGGAMIQVGDRVDVYCTLSNDNAAFGGAGTVTAIIAKGLRVIARFNSTRTAAPPPPSGDRPYTLETSPYRAALINLSASIGGHFTLLVTPRQLGEDSSIAVADSALDDPQTERVTTEDLARIFGISPPSQIPIWQVERYSGVNRNGEFTFPGYTNQAANERPGERGNGNGSDKAQGNGYRLPGNGHSAPAIPVPAAVTPGTPTSSKPQSPPLGANGTRMIAAASYGPGNNFGFRPPAVRQSVSASCPTCSKK